MRAPSNAVASCLALSFAACFHDPSAEQPGAFHPRTGTADTFQGVQSLAGWQEFSYSVPVCKNQAGACGQGPRVSTTIQQNQPVDGFTDVAALFSGDNIDGNNCVCTLASGAPCPQSCQQSGGWGANALWEYKFQNPPSARVTSFQYGTDFKVPPGQTVQAIEWDAQQDYVDSTCSGATIINFGMQYAPHNSANWRYFDYGAGAWRDTGVPVAGNPFDGGWHTLSSSWTVDASMTPTLTSLTYDGVTTAVNKAGSPSCKPGYGLGMSVGLQLDNVPGASFTSYYRNYNVTWQTVGQPPPPPPPPNAGCAVSSPASGANVTSPVQINATCTAPAGRNIVAVDVYVDGQNPPAWQSGTTTGNSVSVSPSVPMAQGTRNVTVQAWDDSSPQNIYKTPFSVNVQPTTPAWDPLPELEKSRITGGTFAGGYIVAPADGRLNWYFANIGLLGFVDRIPGEVKQYLNLYISRLRADFTIEDITFADPYHPESSAFSPQAPDSDDSYAATFLSLAVRYVRVTGDDAWWTTNLPTLKNIAYNVLAVPQNPNGLVRTFVQPSSNDLYQTEDNCEVYKGLGDFAALLKDKGDVDAQYYSDVAAPIATAIQNMMYQPSDGAFSVVYNCSGGSCAVNPLSSAGSAYYPRGVTQAFPTAYRLPIASTELDAAWRYLNNQFTSWEDGRYSSDPFLVAAYAAALRGFSIDVQRANTALQHVQNLAATGQPVYVQNLGFYSRIQSVLNGGAPY